METHIFDNCICDHVSNDFWKPLINEQCVCAQESVNPRDPYAVVMRKILENAILNHVTVSIFIGGLNIGDFIQKLPITKVYSSLLFPLAWYI